MTTNTLPTIADVKAPATYKAPADVTAMRTLLTNKASANLSESDILAIIGQGMENGRKATAALAATVKVAMRDTVARYESVGLAMQVLYSRHGRKGEAPAAGTVAGVSDLIAMFEHMEVDPATTFGMSRSTLQVCRDAYVGQASATFPMWSDVKAKAFDETGKAIAGGPADGASSFFGNDAQAPIRYALARTSGRVNETTGHVLERGNRKAGADPVPAEDLRTLAEVRTERTEESARSVADAVRFLQKRSNTLVIGPDITVGTINALTAEDIAKLQTFLAARKDMLKASAAKHDAGSAAAAVKATRKAKVKA